jgi:RimJ/RimL family protein N-acetyltransferase
MELCTYRKILFSWLRTTDAPAPSRASMSWKSAVEDPEAFRAAVASVVEQSLDRHDRWTIRSHGVDAAVASYLTPDPEFFVSDPNVWETAWIDGTLVGFVQPLLYTDERRDDRPMGTIGYIGVLPSQRGNGYALDLIARATGRLFDLGVWRIVCDTDTENNPMIAAFERFGYVRGRTREFPIDGWHE